MPVRITLSILLLSGILISCNQKNEEESTFHLQDVFVEILDSTLQGYEGVYYYENILKLDSAMRTFKAVTLDDKFNYYRYAIGYYLHTAKDYGAAIRYSDSTFNLVNQHGGPEKHLWLGALVYYGLGEIYLNMGRFSESYAYFYKGKTLAEKTNRPCAINDYNFLLGFVLYKQENYELAAYYFKASIDNLSDCDNQFQFVYRQQEALNNVALSYLKASDYENAATYFFRGLSYISNKQKEGIINKERADIAKGVIYGNLGQLHAANNLTDSARYYYKKSIAINHRSSGDIKDAQLNLLHLAQLHLRENQPDSAGILLAEVSHSMQEVPNQNAMMKYHQLKAMFFDQTEKRDSALHYFKLYLDDLQNDISNKKGFFSFNITNELKNIEKDFAVKTLRQENRLKIVYLIILFLVLASLSVITLLIMRNNRRSKSHIKDLELLNNAVTAQKQQLEKTLQLLAQKSEEKDHLLRVVAHDLRNPISAVYSLSDILLKENSFADEPTNFIQLIQKSSFTALELINELLDDNALNIIANRKTHNLKGIVSHCIDVLKMAASAKNQHLVFKQTDGEIWVNVNEEKMIRVICNILSNAIKFTPDGKQISVKLKREPGFAVVAITDQGIGISESMLPHLFSRFTTARRTGTAGEKSFGLGLSICKQIVDAHGGTIDITSVLNSGTTVTIRLPEA